MTETDFDAELSSINKKITSNENDLKKLKAFDLSLSYFIGKSQFEEDGTQNYLLFQSLNIYFKIVANAKYISS